MPNYLFIRILEACNAGCFMCDFCHSTDEYRLSEEDYTRILSQAKKEGLKYVRLTGGEPLKHDRVLNFISIAKEMGIMSSIISNGYYLPDIAEQLAKSGLSQIIVSLDGSSPKTHNRYRNTPEIFERGVEGLKKCAELGIHTRVNTVAGIHNYAELIELQEIFTELEVEKWELSALKLDRPINYPEAARQRIISDVDTIYRLNPARGFLKPMGKAWCGETQEETECYFEKGIPPTPDNVCKLVHQMRYYDAKNGYLFPCSLLPHRLDRHVTNVKMGADDFSTLHDMMLKSVRHFSENGPNICTGCSATAAGFKTTGDEWEF